MRLAFKRGWWGAVLPGQVPKLTVQVGPVQVNLTVFLKMSFIMTVKVHLH
jgi:hypothetical protein